MFSVTGISRYTVSVQSANNQGEFIFGGTALPSVVSALKSACQ